MVIDKTSQRGAERGAVTGGRRRLSGGREDDSDFLAGAAEWQEGHTDTQTGAGALEKKREGAAACTRARTHTHTKKKTVGGREEKAQGKAKSGKFRCVWFRNAFEYACCGPAGWLLSSPVCLCPHRWLSLCAVGMTRPPKWDGWTPWCPNLPTEGYSLIFHLTLQMPFFPIY